MHQGAVERMRIREHLLLHHYSTLVLVHVFDRILDRDDLAPALRIDNVHHIIEGGGFARARRPGDEKETVGSAR